MADQDINKVNESIKETLRLLRQLREGFNLADAATGFEKDIQAVTRLNRLLAERSRLMREARSAPRANVPGGAPDQAAPGQPALEPRKLMIGFADEMGKQAKANKMSTEALERKARADKRRADLAEKAAQEERQLQIARNKLINDPRYQDALAQAKARGFKPSDLRGIEDRGGGVQGLRFANQTGGVNNQFRTYASESGRATPGISSQFRSFGSDILRDIGQFTKWSIAVAAVYTPLQKLGELIVIMTENESKLADAAIAANVEFTEQGEIFDNVATAANAAGESISTTIDAYSQAIRAAGRYATEEEKAQKATQLLTDSLILSKLSTLDQATAIDTLSASLLQTDKELDQGQELLNKWVRVSQVANVGIDGLATGVAVLGDAAETSGLDIDHLNGLIAVLSEQSISGSKEAANTAKALIGSYQSDKAEAALTKYGFALRKTNGEVRGFLEIYQDLAKAREEGILSEPAVSELALALGGGGVRRAKDASALINSQDRLNQLAEESAAITGDSTLAQDSLAKKLETVETASTRLGNAWQEMAQTLGDDGGLLDAFKGTLNGLTAITSAADDLFTLLGRSGPILTTFIAGLVALSNVSGGVKATALSKLGGQFQGFLGGQAQYGGNYGGGVGGFGKGILADVLQLNRRGGTAIGAAAVGVSAVSNLQAGKNDNAAANLIGGLIGGAIGGALSGGVGIAAGATIGSSVADSFVTGLTTHSKELDAYFAGRIEAGRETASPEETTIAKEKSTEELISEAYKVIGGGSEAFGEITAWFKYQNSQKVVNGMIQKGAEGSYGSSEAAAFDILKEKDPELYKALQARQQTQQAQQIPITAQAEIGRLQALAEQERARQLQNVSTGELRPAQFGQISDRLAGFPTAAKQEIDAFGDAFIGVSADIDDTSEAYNALLELVVNGTDEQQAQINSYVSDIQKMQAAWDNWSPENKTLDLTTGTKTFETQADLKKYLTQTQGQAAEFTNSAIIQARLQKLQLPSISGSATEATSDVDFQQIKQQAEKIQQQFFTDMNLTNEEIKHLTNNLEDFSLLVERAGEDHFETITGIDQRFWDAAQKLLADQNKLKDEKGLGFQKFDIPMSQLEGLASQSLQIGQSWQDKFNYDFKPEDQIAIDNQGIVQPLHADFKILALLLEKIVDQNQKQLDGQYNIPEGATFWVPLTAAYYRNQQQGGSGLGEALSSLDLGENTSATDQNTGALTALTTKLSESPVAVDKFLSKNNQDTRTQGGRQIRQSVLDRKSEEAGYGISTVTRPRISMLDRKSEEAGFGGSPVKETSAVTQFLAQLRSVFQGLITTPGRNVTGGAVGAAGGGLAGPGAMGGGINNRASTNSAPVTPQTKLDLKVSSNINLQVDGRILASVMQNYLASELLRTEQSQGTVTKRYVI